MLPTNIFFKYNSLRHIAGARKRKKELYERLEGFIRDAGIDLWVTRVAPGPAPEGNKATGNPAMNMLYSNLPSVSIPAGKAANGLPLGLQLIGPLRGDELPLS